MFLRLDHRGDASCTARCHLTLCSVAQSARATRFPVQPFLFERLSPALKLDPPFIEAIQHLNARRRVFIPWDLKKDSQVSRGTPSTFTERPSNFENVFAISSGVMRWAASSSTVRCPCHVSCSSSAAVLPMSAVATMGTDFSSGCRKLAINPVLVAGFTSQLEFSMNHPGRKNVMGTVNFRSASSMIVCCVNKFGRVTCAPMVDKYTTRPGRASCNAELSVAVIVRASRKSGAGSKHGGTSTNTPSAPRNAAVKAAPSLLSAVVTSQPRAAHSLPLATSRTTARKGFFAPSKCRATSCRRSQ